MSLGSDPDAGAATGAATGADPPGAAWADDVAVPALLRVARGTYGRALRRALEHEGFEDVPPSGAFVLSALARAQAPLADIVASLGASKQTAGKLVDTLVARGYLDRAVDAGDRRRLTVALTDRGTAAAATVRAAVDAVDAELARRVGPDALAVTRRVLGALIEQRADDPTGTEPT